MNIVTLNKVYFMGFLGKFCNVVMRNRKLFSSQHLAINYSLCLKNFTSTKYRFCNIKEIHTGFFLLSKKSKYPSDNMSAEEGVKSVKQNFSESDDDLKSQEKATKCLSPIDGSNCKDSIKRDIDTRENQTLQTQSVVESESSLKVKELCKDTINENPIDSSSSENILAFDVTGDSEIKDMPQSSTESKCKDDKSAVPKSKNIQKKERRRLAKKQFAEKMKKEALLRGFPIEVRVWLDFF